jgi:regulator of replication initiation timing|tara:strand:- start:650 stop:832 length:183 start_codon:yes stop_codon:yes gene_type:complete
MSEPTVIDAEYEVTELNLFERVSQLEQQIAHLLQGHRNILAHFTEMIVAVKEFSEESSEE